MTARKDPDIEREVAELTERVDAIEQQVITRLDALNEQAARIADWLAEHGCGE